MKKFIYIAVVFMLTLTLFGCFATMTPEERKATYDMRKEVGNRQFVGDTDVNFDAKGMMKALAY